MLNKLLGARKLTYLLQRQRQKLPHKGGAGAGVEECMLPLKIVHPGGVVERYYMAVPAVRIMEAYPSFMVARPEVFRRPWDSVVHPDEILNPGEKFFVVPRRTLQKLRRRIRRPKGDLPSNSFSSQSSRNASPLINEASYSTDTDTQSRDRRMRLSGIEGMQKNGNGDEDPRKMTLNPQSQQRMRRVRNVISWQPSLTAINE
ncbi:hypothetical protein PVL29_015782 [Vitis rotundifolia]|uniref:Uncharacterized protein n=1 Tax=Vitis rotundifolia TaxID=103349 RepID=A0AA38ZDK7_VITRO|nr:hypothetical protein PVL29_015782 [Vitis rotundifolia]